MPPKKSTKEGDSANPSAAPGNGEGNGQGAAPEAPMSGTNTPVATPTGTPAPPTPSSRPGSARPSPAIRGRGGAKPLPKFAGRRSATARAELEAAEAKKREAEAKAAAEEAKKKAKEDRKFGYGRGRGGPRGGPRGGRGRGGHIGDRPREYASEASGVFGGGQTSADIRSARTSRPGGFGSGGGGGGGGGGRSGASGYSGGSGIKRESGDIEMGGMRMHIKAEDGGYISSDEDENEGDKRDVDRMQVIDLTGDQEPDIEDPFVPVRLSRVPHKERAVGLQAEELPEGSDAAEAVSEKRKGKQRARDVEVTGTAAVPNRPTTYSSSDTEPEPQIKREPTDDDQTRPTTPELASAPNAAGAVSPGADLPSSPERRRKAKEKIKESAEIPDEGEESDIERPPEPHFQTQAEKDEWIRFYDDKQKVRHELGRLLPKDGSAPDADGDTAMAEETGHMRRAKARQEERENHVYLFQFPPVLPDLKAVTIKDDPDAAEANGNPDGDAMDVEESTAPAGAATAPETSSGSTRPSLPSGQVGKLRVHKSGKTTLDWGGTSMVLNLGADATFLQNVLVAKVPETKPKEGDQPPEDVEDASAMGMGLIRAKFVLTPDWDEILK
ncbi:hypothetical protein CERZMDRAFT_109180 [Cercospora zeae-maydis SCOH1-5]|uniref:Uncharacterized protein n=1 Tax=Cercospora zeae-maydis SCOH1-5 TaxID=717836 RepID=A0A6A6FS35_9PEZI|nr:hypothetical protein CERZMDRAFT_109180 [Cercospora zeae-maydis SCOH1-5]